MNTVEEQIINQIIDRINSDEWNQVGCIVKSQVMNHVRFKVLYQVCRQVWGHVEEQVIEQLSNRVTTKDIV